MPRPPQYKPAHKKMTQPLTLKSTKAFVLTPLTLTTQYKTLKNDS